MTVGSRLRQLLGPATDPVARFYRKWYVDLDDFGRSLSHFGPVERVVEVGCGDGHLTERLVAELPGASVLGIDIAEAPGRLYGGDPARATFEQISAGELAARAAGTFDLVVMSDVLHHVPVDRRADLLADVRALTSPGGHIVVKDWVAGRNPASMAAWLSDRYITGDRIEFFADRDEFVRVVEGACRPVEIVAEGRVPPRWNNIYVALRAA